MPRQKLTSVLSAASPRLDLAVQALVPGASRAYVRGMFDHGCVTLDGQPCRDAATPAMAGQRVGLDYDPQQKYRETTKARMSTRFAIAHEDAHLIVVEKVAGILTVPTERGEQDTLVHEVARYFSKGQRITHKAFIVHRLDRDTSGLLVFAKSQAVASALKDQFEARKPDREYVAIAAGKIADAQGTIRSHLTTNEDLDQYSTDTPGEGKLAVTHFKVERRLRGATWLRVRLETGRRNQIRVHLAEAGHPILGDVRYEVELARHPAWKWSRLALHAQSLGFTHPVTGKDIRVTSQIPACFEDFARATRL